MGVAASEVQREGRRRAALPTQRVARFASDARVRANYYTRNHKSEIPLENATEHPLDISRTNPLDK